MMIMKRSMRMFVTTLLGRRSRKKRKKSHSSVSMQLHEIGNAMQKEEG
jgi:hypothetical protein